MRIDYSVKLWAAFWCDLMDTLCCLLMKLNWDRKLSKMEVRREYTGWQVGGSGQPRLRLSKRCRKGWMESLTEQIPVTIKVQKVEKIWGQKCAQAPSTWRAVSPERLDNQPHLCADKEKNGNASPSWTPVTTQTDKKDRRKKAGCSGEFREVQSEWSSGSHMVAPKKGEKRKGGPDKTLKPKWGWMISRHTVKSIWSALSRKIPYNRTVCVRELC